MQQFELPRVEVIEHESVKFTISYKGKSVSFVVDKNTREMKDFIEDGLEVRLMGRRDIMNVLSLDKNEHIGVSTSGDLGLNTEYHVFNFVIDSEFQLVYGNVDYIYNRIYTAKSARKI